MALQEVESKVRFPVEEHEVKLRNNLLIQRQQMLNCDLSLQVGEENIAAHSCVVAAFSPKIATHISKECAKNVGGRRGGKVKKFTIDLSSFSLEVVNAVVEAFYCGVLEVERHQAQELLDAVEWFQTPELVSLIKEFLLEEERTVIKVFPSSCIKTTTQREKRRTSSPDKSSACSVRSVSQSAEEETVTKLVTRSGRLSKATMKKANYDKAQKGSKTLSVAVGKLVKTATQLNMTVEKVRDDDHSLSENISDQGAEKDAGINSSNVPRISVTRVEKFEHFSHLKSLLCSPLKVKQKRKLFKPIKIQLNTPGKKGQELDTQSSTVEVEVIPDIETATKEGINSPCSNKTFSTEETGLAKCEATICDKDKHSVEEVQKTVLDDGEKGIDVTQGPGETEEDLWQNENTTFESLDRSILDPNLAPELDFLLGKVDRIRCKWCLLTFTKIDEYNNHISNHPKYKCDLCPREFNFKHHRTRHVMRDHENNVHLKCNDCPFQGGTEAQLRAHTLGVHSKKPFQCPVEGCSFASLKHCYLANHSQIHASVKRFSCEKCGQSFALKQGLRSHRRACFTLEEFLCDLCGQGFNHFHSLKCHRKTFHFGEKPYTCDICKHAFSYRANLRRHKRIHENSFPYSCLVCKQKFRHSNSLKAHVKKHKDLPTDLEMSMTDFRSPRNRLGGRNYKKYRQNNIISTGSTPISPEIEMEQAVVFVPDFHRNSMPLFPTNEVLSIQEVSGKHSAQMENVDKGGTLVDDEDIESSVENNSDDKTRIRELSSNCKEEQGMEVSSGLDSAGALVEYLPQLPLKTIQVSSESPQDKVTFIAPDSSEKLRLHPQGEFEKNIPGAVANANACSIVVTSAAGSEGEPFSEILTSGLSENGGNANKEEAMAVEMLTPEGTSLARVIFATSKKNPGLSVGSCRSVPTSTSLAPMASRAVPDVKTETPDVHCTVMGSSQGGISAKKLNVGDSAKKSLANLGDGAKKSSVSLGDGAKKSLANLGDGAKMSLSVGDGAKTSLALGGKTNGQASLETLAEICFNSSAG